MSISHSTKAKYPWPMLASTYITQYIGVAFILSAAVAILRQQGVALDKLALLNLAVLPLMGKVLYAPLIDKLRLPLQGRYRSWLIIAQSSMVLLLVLAGALDFQQQFSLIIIILAIYAFCMSVQDVAVDGLSCKLFDAESRKLASSVQFSGNLMGNIIGGGLILMFYPWLQWQGSLWLLAALTAISLVFMLLFSEPEASTQSTGEVLTELPLFREINQFCKQHWLWLLALVLYPISSTCGFALLNPLLVDSGWTLEEVGFALKIFGSAVGLCAALLASPLIARVGRINALIAMLFVQLLALLLIVPLTLGMTDRALVYAAISVHFISFPALLVISSTLMMDKAAYSSRKATIFTLQFSLASLFGFLYSSISMALAKYLGYTTVVVAAAVLGLAVTLFIGFVLKRTLTGRDSAMPAQRFTNSSCC